MAKYHTLNHLSNRVTSVFTSFEYVFITKILSLNNLQVKLWEKSKKSKNGRNNTAIEYCDGAGYPV